MIKKQLEILTSQYTALYDLIIPKDHMLRRINEEIDFSMIEDELINKPGLFSNLDCFSSNH